MTFLFTLIFQITRIFNFLEMLEIKKQSEASLHSVWAHDPVNLNECNCLETCGCQKDSTAGSLNDLCAALRALR
jgi:hypothetical protein